MGTLYWQLNDCWPAVSWSSMDGLGNWKALQYHAKKAFENVIISTAQTEKNVAIYVVNDTFAEVKKTWLANASAVISALQVFQDGLSRRAYGWHQGGVELRLKELDVVVARLEIIIELN